MTRVLNSYLLLMPLLLLTTAGCGGGGDAVPRCYPVRGQVLYQGKPVAEGMVFFHPLNDTANTQRPMDVTDAEGRFELTTRRPGDGAQPGQYTITVELRDLRQDGDEMVRDGRNLLPGKYRLPETSGLEFTVVEGDNEVPVIELE